MHGVHAPLTTHLYDKRRRPDFRSFKLIRFPHISSFLNQAGKYNIVISQFHRFRRIILDADAFTTELAALLSALIGRGYNKELLKKKLKAQFHYHPGLYGFSSPYLMSQVFWKLAHRPPAEF